jgi:ABC-type polysaccharide/polyol phosphate export permease
MLALRTFHIRNTRTRLTLVWACAQPALQTAIFALVFLRFVKLDTPEDYVGFLLTGVLPWSLFAQGVTAATHAIVDNADIVRKLPTPRGIFPVSALLAASISLSPIFVILIGVSQATGHLGVRVVLILPALALELALALGIGLIAGAVYVQYRDVRPVVENGLFAAFYLTPVVYDASVLAGGIHSALRCNPMTGVLSLYRGALLESPVDGVALLVALGIAAVTLSVGAALFRQRAGEFADLL